MTEIRRILEDTINDPDVLTAKPGSPKDRFRKKAEKALEKMGREKEDETSEPGSGDTSQASRRAAGGGPL